jgi:hypothetical protein
LKTILLLLSLLFSLPLYAATGLAFLEIPVGARETALGGAGVALTTGPTSAVYNPAALAFAPRASVAFQHTKHFGDTRGNFVGLTFLPGKFALSPHYWGTRTGDIEFRTEPSRNPLATFDAAAEVVGVSTGYLLCENIGVGATGHYIHQKIQAEGADGFALDLGFMGRDIVRGFSAGVALNHLGDMSAFVADEPQLPTTVRVGGTYEHTLGRAGALLVTAEGHAIKENVPRFVAGLEWQAPDYVSLRAGWVEGIDAQNFSAGFGLLLKQVHLDYSFVPYQEELDAGHRFSVGIDF